LLKNALDYHKTEYNLATILGLLAYNTHHKNSEFCNSLIEQIRNYKYSKATEVFSSKILSDFLDKAVVDVEYEFSNEFKQVFNIFIL